MREVEASIEVYQHGSFIRLDMVQEIVSIRSDGRLRIMFMQPGRRVEGDYLVEEVCALGVEFGKEMVRGAGVREVGVG